MLLSEMCDLCVLRYCSATNLRLFQGPSHLHWMRSDGGMKNVINNQHVSEDMEEGEDVVLKQKDKDLFTTCCSSP